jgi:hypothetical protein
LSYWLESRRVCGPHSTSHDTAVSTYAGARVAVGQVIGELKRQGLPILLVEQNLAMGLAMADRVHVISRGRVVHSSTPAELLANEEVRSLAIWECRDPLEGPPAFCALTAGWRGWP